MPGYDGGDCCECTCVDTEMYTCGDYGGFACLDPSASCVDDDDVTALPGYYSGESSDPKASTGLSCYLAWLSDGDCDLRNNKKDCGELVFLMRSAYIPSADDCHPND